MEFIVSVRLMCYNQSAFIGKAMESILMQKTNFPVEIVVGDDFSTDGTLDIIRQYAETENIRIKILERKIGDDYWKERQAKGRLYNFTNILDNCSGKYVSLLDGDDYWIDQFKLQKQVDFLESNLDYSGCYTNYKVCDKNGSILVESNIDKKRVSYYDHISILRSGVPMPLTVMYRNIPEAFKQMGILTNIYNGDQVIAALLSQKGRIKYLDSVTGVYRIGIGSFSSKSTENRMLLSIETFSSLRNIYQTEEAQDAIDGRINGLYLSLIYNSILKLKLSKAIEYNKLRKKKLSKPVKGFMIGFVIYLNNGIRARFTRFQGYFKANSTV